MFDWEKADRAVVRVAGCRVRTRKMIAYTFLAYGLLDRCESPQTALSGAIGPQLHHATSQQEAEFSLNCSDLIAGNLWSRGGL